ncbi:MAG: hypothetical protein ABI867_11045 [Kofleriaceae bacterium]
MTALSDLQAQLASARNTRAAAERTLADARKKGATALAQASANRARLVAAENSIIGQITQLGNPTVLIKHLDDSYPIVMFPLRLETRFKVTGNPKQHELWIRAYPDDCQVQTFTDFITDAELDHVRQFWVGWWAAGSQPDQQRAAWRGLVSQHGSGRAQLLVERVKPAAAAPVKAPTDVILVILTGAAPPTTTTVFWTTTWIAGKDAVAAQAAWDTLVDAIGLDPAHAVLAAPPDNLDDLPPPGLDRTAVNVTVATLLLPPPPPTVTSSWQQAPRATTLPECLVFAGYKGDTTVFQHHGRAIPSTLAVGPDPSLPPGEQITRDGAELKLNDDLKWLGSFDEAIARGMGIKIPLPEKDYNAGFDRVVVLGVRMGSDPEHGAQLLEALFRDHAASKSGLSLLPQGTPTNNTEDLSSGYSWQDDPDASFDRVFGTAKDWPASGDPLAKRDGQWLAEALGISLDAVRHLPHADGFDQAHAKALNTALWPTTWGDYFLNQVGAEVPAKTVESVRTFFIRYISGRGSIPPIRIGKQPYGILPAAPRQGLYLDPNDVPDKVPIPPKLPGAQIPKHQPAPRVGTTVNRPGLSATAIHPAPIATGPIATGPIFQVNPWSLDFTESLKDILDRITASFDDLVPGVPRIVGSGDEEQKLLEIIAQLPSSVEFYQRYATTFQQLMDRAIAENWLAAVLVILPLLAVAAEQWVKVLGDLGFAHPDKVPMVNKLLQDGTTPLTGGTVDDLPLSETEPLRPISADGKNYLAWLATEPFDTIRREDFGSGHPTPRSLLYIMARQALLLTYWDGSLDLLAKHDAAAATAARKEVASLQLGLAHDGVSKYAHLVTANAQITGDAHISVADYLDRAQVRLTPEGARVHALRLALGALASASTAQLERVFAEHIDLCSYRLDAWRLGLVHHRHAQQRQRHARGSYLGVFGWIEHLAPENKVLKPGPLGSPLGASVIDESNLGYVHAPSIAQATTAAILRNAYHSHATDKEPDLMAVNLSSARVRIALAIVDGIRHGQGLAELLGYQFERGLHDHHKLDGVELEAYLLLLRQRFPLVTNRMTPKLVPAEVTASAARNVIDGVALVETARTGAYPWGIAGLPAAAKAPILAELDRVLDANDAVADLMLAEQVHHVIHGQMERAANAANVLGAGARPQPVEVVDTPSSGLVVVHRVGVHLDSAATAVTGASPRAIAEPALEAWLAARLPAPADVAVVVHLADPVHGARDVIVSQADLRIGALDLLHVLILDGEPAFGELDERIVRHVRTTEHHPGLAIEIRYAQAIADRPTLFEVSAQIRALRGVVLHSRPLAATDVVRAADAGSDGPRWDANELATRVATALAGLNAAANELMPIAADTTTATETYVERASGALAKVASYGVSQTSLGGSRARIAGLYGGAVAKLAAVIDRWQHDLADFDKRLAALPGLVDDAARLTALARAEELVSNVPLAPRPATVAAFQTALATKRAVFVAKLAELQALTTVDAASASAWFDVVEPVIATLPPFDPVPFNKDNKANDLAAERDDLALVRSDVAARLLAVRTAIATHVAAATDLLAQAKKSAVTKQAIELVIAASREVLGAEAKLLPRFTLAADPSNDLKSAYAARDAITAGLVAAGREFPVDDWLYGVARVRPRMASWETMTMLAETFGASSPALAAVQLPFRADDHWVALELPATYALSEEKLAYTASFAKPFEPAGAHAGLVIDEWTEVIPGTQETTGIAFHYDQPNNEPPQAILIAAPRKLSGEGWKWDDLVACVVDTFTEAKLRAIEPDKVGGATFGQFLPATLFVATGSALTIAANLADNNA